MPQNFALNNFFSLYLLSLQGNGSNSSKARITAKASNMTSPFRWPVERKRRRREEEKQKLCPPGDRLNRLRRKEKEDFKSSWLRFLSSYLLLFYLSTGHWQLATVHLLIFYLLTGNRLPRASKALGFVSYLLRLEIKI